VGAKQIERVAVIGLGTMGAGIAQVLLEGGHGVVGRDVDDAAIGRGRERIEFGLGKRVEKGRMQQSDATAALARFSTTASLEECADADLVVEAIVEDLDAKQALFAALGELCPPATILATNTSALPVMAIAAASGRPERCLGLHFFNPAPLMPLVEVVRTVLTQDEPYEAAYQAVIRSGKTAVRCSDTPGFVVNRILIPLMNDAVRTLDETGASAADVDVAMRLGAGWPMGPFTLLDLIGVDVHVHAAEALFAATREPRMAPPPRLARMVEAGLLGRKTGRGFFDYDD
jgi:3-hydroxybutyryl-CoA dehydrogenase